jgi:hypothetical protein
MAMTEGYPAPMGLPGDNTCSNQRFVLTRLRGFACGKPDFAIFSLV